MKTIDLHVHSTFSDGTLTPTELIKLAKDIGLSGISLTDHDCIDGLTEAKNTSKDLNIEFLNGIEFSCSYKNREIHILGYGFDAENKELNSKILKIVSDRNERNKKMLENLNYAGFEITVEDLSLNSKIITRAHFAKALMNKGYVTKKETAFNNLLSSGTKTYVPKKDILPEEITSIIKNAGGVSVLAHPLLYGFKLKELESEIKILKNAGVMGIECLYSLHTKQQAEELMSLAFYNKMCVTGGSDFHGFMKTNIYLGIGRHNLKIPYEIFQNLSNLTNQN